MANHAIPNRSAAERPAHPVICPRSLDGRAPVPPSCAVAARAEQPCALRVASGNADTRRCPEAAPGRPRAERAHPGQPRNLHLCAAAVAAVQQPPGTQPCARGTPRVSISGICSTASRCTNRSCTCGTRRSSTWSSGSTRRSWSITAMTNTERFEARTGRRSRLRRRGSCGRADLVFTVSPGLRARRVDLNPNTFVVRNGVDADYFARALAPEHRRRTRHRVDSAADHRLHLASRARVLRLGSPSRSAPQAPGVVARRHRSRKPAAGVRRRGPRSS